MSDKPVYPIGVIAEFLNVHPETIRVWERYKVIEPKRRSGKRFYSEDDLQRLRFVKKLIEEGLNLPAICYYLKLYPCWYKNDCLVCMHRTERISCAKPCWKEEGTYCQVSGDENICLNCEFSGNKTLHSRSRLTT